MEAGEVRVCKKKMRNAQTLRTLKTLLRITPQLHVDVHTPVPGFWRHKNKIEVKGSL